MATETSINTYTGVEGVLTIGGNPFAYVKSEVTIDRDVVEIERGGKWGSISLPGKVKPSIKITYGLVDADLLFNALDDGTLATTTSDEQLLAATAGDGTIKPVEAGLSNPSTPMTIKLKIISTDGYSAGSVTINGTDNNDDDISETIPFLAQASGSTTVYYYGSQKFKTINMVTLPAVLAANDTVTVYGAGQKSTTIGKPLYFTYIGKMQKSANQYVQIQATNCWLKGLTLPLNAAVGAAIIDQELIVRDPDSDITLTEDA